MNHYPGNHFPEPWAPPAATEGRYRRPPVPPSANRWGLVSALLGISALVVMWHPFLETSSGDLMAFGTLMSLVACSAAAWSIRVSNRASSDESRFAMLGGILGILGLGPAVLVIGSILFVAVVFSF